MNQIISAIAAPAEAEVSLAYEVEVRAIGPTDLLSDDGRGVLQELMDRAKSAAIDVLDGMDRPLPASLAATVAIAIRCWDALGSSEAALAREAHLSDELAYEAAGLTFVAAQEAFEEAFNTLKTRFEKEFPHHG